MIQITWVEILLTGWFMATLVFSIGFCVLHYKKMSEQAAQGLYAGLGHYKFSSRHVIASRVR